MFRFTTWLVVAVSIGASASAQNNLTSRLKPVTAPVRLAGTYHLSAGKWTRATHNAAIGSDVLYNNTCTTGYFGAMLPTEIWTDEGRIPSPTSPDTATSKPGCATSYVVDGFQIAYCTATPSAAQITLSFFASYAPCTDSTLLTPTASFALTGLPGSGGVEICWMVSIDLTGQTFTMAADADGHYDGNDNFGWSFQIPSSSGSDGLLIAGNPALCGAYDHTVFAPVPGSGQGTGMDTLDRFRVDGTGTVAPGCYFFGGIPFASFHLQLFATAACAPEPGSGFCFGDGSATACPCGNAGHIGFGQGCDNSEGHPARLTALGVASVSSDTLVLRSAGMTATTFAVFMQGTAKDNGGAGSLLGDGLSCITGTMIHLGAKPGANGVALYPEAGDPSVSVAGGISGAVTRFYQVWYRDAASFCTASSLNTSNGYQVVWAP